MKRILIVGSTGMLGNTLKLFLSQKKFEIKTLDRKDLNLGEANKEELKEKIIQKGCDVLINCAGLIKQRKDVTTEDFISVNSLLPHRLANICEEQNMEMIHITTDCVFDGLTGSYSENSEHNIQDDYGRSKSMGEPKNCTIIRTSIIGEENNNKLSLLEWVRSNKNTNIKGYDDHFWNGVTSLQLGKIIKQIIDENLYWDGVRHVFTEESVTKYALVKMINEIYELGNNVEKVNSNNICNRTLKSEYCNKVFNIPFLYKQIMETKEFHDKIKNKNLDEYYTKLI